MASSMLQSTSTRPATAVCCPSHLCAPRLRSSTVTSRSLRLSQPTLRTKRAAEQRVGALPASVPTEILQLAGKESIIGSTATIIFAAVLVGLALGFVLLRVESLVEEGKINF